MTAEAESLRVELRDVASRLFERVANTEAVADIWGRYCEAGLVGVALPAEIGGSGLGAAETCVVLEEAGRMLAPGPLPEALATLPVIARHAEPGLVQRLFEDSAHPPVIVPCIANGTMPVRAVRMGEGWALEGEVAAVGYAAEAEGLLVIAEADDGPLVALAMRGNSGVTIDPQQGIDHRPCAGVRFDRAAVSANLVLAGNGGTVAAELLARVKLCAAAVQLGVASEALRRTAEYVSHRKQFGAPLAAKQAVRQRLADGFIDVESMRSTLQCAAAAFDDGADPAGPVETAHYWAVSSGHRVVHAAQHLHGGIGADVSYPIHRFFLAAARMSSALGGAEQVLATIGRMIANDEMEALT